MTETAQPTQEHYIGMSTSLQQRASRLFDNNINTIMQELMQNARRAGATRITVDVGVNAMTIHDNGKGIFSEGFNIDLGGSGWNPTTIKDEDAAGMGLFSLAQRTPTISSCGWRTSISEKAFNGLEPVTLEPVEHIQGTEINFRLDPRESESMSTVVLRAGVLLPVEVILNGKPITQKPGLVREGTGVRLDNLLISDQSDAPTLWRSSFVSDPNGIYLVVNFFGTVVLHQLPNIPTALKSMRLYIYVDILEAENNKLQMVLPSRNALVECDFLQRVIKVGLTEIGRGFCRVPHDLHYAAYAALKQLTDVDIPESTPMLYCCGGEASEECLSRENPTTCEDVLLLKMDWPQEIQVNRACKTRTLLRYEPRNEGYKWFDSLPVASELVIMSGDEQIVIPETEMGDSLEVLVVKDLKIKLPQADLEFPVDVYCSQCYAYNYVQTDNGDFIYISEGTSVSDAVIEIRSAVFDENDERDDSYEQQRESFTVDVLNLLKGILATDLEVLKVHIKTMWDNNLWGVLPPNHKVTIISSGEDYYGLSFEIEALP